MRSRQAVDRMKIYGKAEGRQTDSRTAGCPKTDWQVGDRIIQYEQAVNIQRSGKRQTYKRQVVDTHTATDRQAMLRFVAVFARGSSMQLCLIISK